MRDSNFNLAGFHDKRDSLVALLERCELAMSGIDMTSWSQTVAELKQKLASERFKLLVLGEFKRGKSTFINAMLGREVLPAFPTPCTAIINELKWGEQPSAILHFKAPLPSELPGSLDVEARRHIERHLPDAIPPMEVRAEDLERFVVIRDSNGEETPYERAVISWPLGLLSDSVEIIDSPGLNEHGSRTQITMDYLGQVDAVLFMFSVHAFASQSELAVIDNDLIGSGHSDLFFICNRFDELRKEAHRTSVVNEAYQKLADRTSLGREGIFFVSALDAVIGREEGDSSLIDRSGIPGLENTLATFLTRERGRIKLMQPARQLNAAIKVALHEVIPAQRTLLESSKQELQRRYDDARPQLEQAERNQQAVLQRLQRATNRMKDAVHDAAALHLRNLADQIPIWASEVEVDQQLNLLKVWTVQEQLEGIAEELSDRVSHLAEDATYDWRERRLKPLLEDHLADFMETAESEVEDFMDGIAAIRCELTGLDATVLSADDKVSPAERVLSGIGGFIIGGAGSAIEGAVLGYEGMLKSLIPQVALAVGAIVVLHLNPVTVVPALMGMAVFRTLRKGGAITGKVRGTIGNEMANLLSTKSTSICTEMSRVMADRAEEQIDEIGSRLDRELDSVREQVDSVLKSKEQGDVAVAEQFRLLGETESLLRAVDTDLTEFISDLAGS